MKLEGKELNLESVWHFVNGGESLELSSSAKEKVSRSRKYILSKIKEPIYGVNTGFGALSSVCIPHDQLEELQVNIIRSHSVGVGKPFSKKETRAIMLLRANALARGHSGIRPEVIEKILEYLNKNVLPIIPQQGSVGASGDLAPLSHLALALIGEGKVWSENTSVETQTVLKKKNIKPLVLEEKEGLSLINGCQVMTAIGLLNAYRIRDLIWLSDIAGSMSLEALRGSKKAFDPLISSVRPHSGEIKTAKNLLKCLGPVSDIAKSHEDCDKVQDAYSLRCMPAVHGAVKDALRHAVHVLETEANSSTDNPLVFCEEDKILSCGNFHGAPVAFVLDYLSLTVTGLSNISERRIEKLVNPEMSELPAFLIEKSGLHSGMMMVHVAAASLVNENKVLSHPASVDSIPTSANKEDHVSMGTTSSRKLRKIVDNVEKVIAMELLCAAQALDFLKPLKPTAGVKAAHEKVRSYVSFAQKDRVFSEDIEIIREKLPEILQAVTSSIGDLEW